jgi:hypothetical protein
MKRSLIKAYKEVFNEDEGVFIDDIFYKYEDMHIDSYELVLIRNPKEIKHHIDLAIYRGGNEYFVVELLLKTVKFIKLLDRLENTDELLNNIAYELEHTGRSLYSERNYTRTVDRIYDKCLKQEIDFSIRFNQDEIRDRNLIHQLNIKFDMEYSTDNQNYYTYTY